MAQQYDSILSTLRDSMARAPSEETARAIRELETAKLLAAITDKVRSFKVPDAEKR